MPGIHEPSGGVAIANTGLLGTEDVRVGDTAEAGKSAAEYMGEGSRPLFELCCRWICHWKFEPRLASSKQGQA